MLRRAQPELILDVGANRGQFALAALGSVPDATIISFEPLTSEGDRFERIFAKNPAVRLQRIALSDRSEFRDLHVTAHADSSSLHRPTQLQTEAFPGTHETAVERVRLERLDRAIAPDVLAINTFLKIDVQGHEACVIRGASRLLDRIRWILVELSFVELYEGQPLIGEVTELLWQEGFQPTDMLPPLMDRRRAVQVDVLFERRDDG